MKWLILFLSCGWLAAQPLTLNDPAFVAGLNGQAVAAAPAWNPASVSGIKYLWEANDLAGANGTKVAVWTDSQASQIFGQSDSGLQPILTNNLSVLNGNKWISFDQSDDCLTNYGFGFVRGRIFLIARLNNTDAASRFIFDSFNGTRAFLYLDASSALSFSGGTAFGTSSYFATNWMLFEMSLTNSTGCQMWTNGVALGASDTYLQVLDIVLGTRYSGTFPGGLQIAGMLVCTNLLSDGDVGLVRTNWAMGKYGVRIEPR